MYSTVKLHFDAVQDKNEAISSLDEYRRANLLLDEACKEIRNISNNMQPGALLKLGIVAGCHIAFGAFLAISVGGACPGIAAGRNPFGTQRFGKTFRDAEVPGVCVK